MGTLEIGKIRIDGGTQPRSSVDRNTIGEYAEAMRNEVKFPPVVVFYDGKEYWLADGFHRRDAALQAGLTEIEVDLKQGTKRDAVLFSVGTNSSHGMRRTNEDKRRAVLKLLEDPEWGLWSDSEIARRCQVSHTFVGEIRQMVTCNVASDIPPALRTYTTKHGSTAQMEVSGIGKKTGIAIEAEIEDDEEVVPAVERIPKKTVIEMKKEAAYSAVELYFNSLPSEEERQNEVKVMRKWLITL
jgi:hypothetical protein